MDKNATEKLDLPRLLTFDPFLSDQHRAIKAMPSQCSEATFSTFLINPFYFSSFPATLSAGFYSVHFEANHYCVFRYVFISGTMFGKYLFGVIWRGLHLKQLRYEISWSKASLVLVQTVPCKLVLFLPYIALNSTYVLLI